VSVGVKGAHYSIGSTGQHVSVGIPGTGVYFRQKVGGKKQKQSQSAAAESGVTSQASHRHAAVEAPALVAVAKPGFTASASEKNFYQGTIAYQQADYQKAHDYFRPLIDDAVIANDALLMGALSGSYTNQYDEAIDMLEVLLASEQSPLPGEPGSLILKYLPDSTIKVPLTQFSMWERPLDMSVVPFVLADLLRAQNRMDDAIDVLVDLYEQMNHFDLLALVLADLYTYEGRYDDLYKLLSSTVDGLQNEDDPTMELLYYWAVALTVKEMYEAAGEVYKQALAKTSGRNPELIKVLQYGRADLYEREGKKADAYRYFAKLMAADPGYYDVADRTAALQPDVSQ
jgi:tetratricopeptide (TPR) repeat protein